MANSVFSGSDYMVKPQANMRPTLSVPDPRILELNKDEDEETPRRSVDSYASPVAASDEETFRPDFLIVRVDNQGGSGDPQGDKVVACIEVKKDNSAYDLALRQLEKYVRTLAPKALYKDFRGILVLGSTIYERRIDCRRMPTHHGQGLLTGEDLETALARIVRNVEKEDRK